MKKNIKITCGILTFFTLLTSNFVFSQTQMKFLITSRLSLNGTPITNSNNLKVIESNDINLSVKSGTTLITNYGHSVINATSATKKLGTFIADSNQFNLQLNFSGGYSRATGGSCTIGTPDANGVQVITSKTYFYQTDPITNLFNFLNGDFSDPMCTGGEINIIPLTLSNSVFTKGICENIKLPTYGIYYYDEFQDPPVYVNETDFYAFKWQYQIGNTGNWVDLPQSYFNTQDDFLYTFKPENILNDNSYVGNLNFRFVIEPSVSTSVPTPIYSDVIRYEIKSCAPKILSQIVQDNNKCFDGNTGSVYIQFDRALLNGETLNLSFKMDGVPYSRNISSLNPTNGYLLDGLLNGNYTDLKFQTQINSVLGSFTSGNNFTITSPSKVTFTTSKTNVLCNGAATGSITVTANGGTGNYQYSKDAGANWQTSNVFNGLVAGNYQVLAKDINSGSDCMAPDGIQTVNITQPTAPLTIQLDSFNNPNSNISLDGYINVSVNGGTGSYTYQWTSTANNISSQSSQEDLSGLGGDASYTLTVTDENNCTATYNISLDAPDPIVITFNNAQILCSGGTTSLTASIVGGNLPYTSFQWIPNSYVPVNTPTTSTLNNIAQGTYTLIVSDAKGVVRSANYTVNAPPPSLNIVGENTVLIASVSSVSQKCYGNNSDTIIDVSVSGGTSPYSYNWYNLSNPTVQINSTEDLSNVPPGSYKLEVKDANNCFFSKNFNVLPANPISFTTTVTNITNPGTAEGLILINATGGTGSYQYSLNGTNWQLGNTFSNLIAGTYSVYVKDLNDCMVGPQTVSISEPPAFTISITILNAISCYNGTNGSLKVSALGGTPFTTGSPYDYNWSDNNGNTYSGDTITNLSAGLYTVIVTDSNGITRTIANYVLNEPSQLLGSTTKENISCYGAANGKITFNPSGGTAPYNYYVNGVLYTSNVITNLAPNTYTCEIKDSNNCALVLPNLFITQPSPLNATATIYPVTNGSSSDGFINLNVTGGTPPYTFNWNPNLGNTNNITNLMAGVYSVIITDNNGCTFSNSYTVATIQPLSVSLNSSNSLTALGCYGDSSGKLEVNVTGGRPNISSPNYLYEWRNSSNQVIGTASAISNLIAGTYTITVTDFNTPSSSIQQTFTITQPSGPLNLNILTTVPILCAGNSGSLSANVTGGTASYAYEWRNNSNQLIGTTQTIANVPSGIYTCKVTDANLCYVSQSFTLTSPVAVTANYTITNVQINSQSTGSITINASGGTGSYTYILNGNITQSNNVFNNLPAGNYVIEIKDNNNCSITLTATITEPSILSTTINQPVTSQILCNGDSSAKLNVSVAGGISPYYYQWKKNGVIIPNAITSLISNLSAGNYEVLVTDNVGATQTATFTINEPSLLQANYTTTQVTCASSNSGSITLNISGGVAPYNYNWSLGTSTTNVLSNIPIGTYNVTVTDANGCSISVGNINITSSTGLNLGATVNNVSCGNLNNGSITLNPTGGSGNYTISWDNSSYTGFVLNNLSPGNYSGTLIDGTCSLPFNFNIQGSTPLEVNLGLDTTLCSDQTKSIDATITGQTVSYNWTSTNGFTSTNPLVSLSDSGIYTLTITTSSGCTYSDSIEIVKLNEPIESKCMVASQTFKDQEIIIVNISERNNNIYEWIVPAQAQVVSQNDDALIVKFNETGKFNISLKAKNQSECESIDFKEILVEEGDGSTIDTGNIFIKQFSIFPNPIESINNEFNVLAELAYEMPVTISIYRLEQGVLINQVNLPPSKIHNKQFNLNMASGVYLVILKTPGSIQAKKVIKS